MITRDNSIISVNVSNAEARNKMIFIVDILPCLHFLFLSVADCGEHELMQLIWAMLAVQLNIIYSILL